MTQVEALMEIARRNGGTITPRQVVEEARNPASVLHGAFTWDDKEAADKWRIREAQHLIRECRVTFEQDGKKQEALAFVGISTDRVNSSADNPYRLAKDVAKDVDLLAVAERDAMAQLNYVKGRYEHLRRLKPVWDAIAQTAG